MGADESACDDVQNDLDFNGDGIIDWDEFIIFPYAWLRDSDDPNWNPQCDLNNDEFVNFVDFSIFAQEWLWEACWRESGTGIWMMGMGAGGGMGRMMGTESMLMSETGPLTLDTQQETSSLSKESSIEEQIEQIKSFLDWLSEIKDEIDEDIWLNLVASLEEMLKELAKD